MPTPLVRSISADLEVRGDGRTVRGLAVPYNEPTEIRDSLGSYTETFRPGAFTDAIRRPESVKFLALHDRQRLPLGRALLLTDTTAGLVGEFRVSATTAGDEVLELVKDGALDGLSVGFEPIKDRWNAARSQVERIKANLREVSLTPWPAYAGATVTGVRHKTTLTTEQARYRLLLIESGKDPNR